MTYLQFHLVFIIPVILFFAWLNRSRFSQEGRRLGYGLLFLSTLAMLYTTPWDNYLVKKQVWGYPPDRVLATIGYVPVEEYAFFILQTLLSGLWLFWFLKKSKISWPEKRKNSVRWLGSAFYLAVALWGASLLMAEGTLYLGLILAWAAPIGLIQWAWGGDILWARKWHYFAAVLVPTAYLCVADRLAIHWNIWYISERFTTGIHLFGLPLEEALFFLFTNIMVVQGLILFWHFCEERSLLQARAYGNSPGVMKPV